MDFRTHVDIYLQYLTGYIPHADKLDPGFADSCPDYRVKISLTKDEYIKTVRGAGYMMG